MSKIKTNKRFDKLTNLDISTHYKDKEYWFMRSDFIGAFAYWVVVQSPYDAPYFTQALKAFEKYVSSHIEDGIPKQFTYSELSEFINEDVFAAIPEINILNRPLVSSGQAYDNRHNEPHPAFDFIDLGALARNMFYMILRENITQS